MMREIILYFGVWLSLVERLVRDQEAGSSNLLTPTTKHKVVCGVCVLACVSLLARYSGRLKNHVVKTDLSLRNGESRNGKVNLERPKVLFNAKTGKYVLWVHYENGKDYHCAACAIACKQNNSR